MTRAGEAPATEILPSALPTQRSSAPTIPSYMSGDSPRVPPATEEHRSNPILTVGVIAIALLLLALVGIVAYFVINQSRASDSNQAKTAASPAASPNSSPAGKQTTADQDKSWPTPSQSETPLKITASSSSVRLAVQSNTYYASNAIDGKRSTAWIEGVDGPGIGEWIRFDFDREINLHRILIQPGYFKSPDIWSQNNRLATVTVQFSDGSSRALSFDNRMDSQRADVGSVRTRWVRVIIRSVYPGTNPGATDDTGFSEIAFEWEP
jgi:hypothetical protein